MAHAAKIYISTEVLLSILDFKGAIVHNIQLRDDMWNPNEIVITMEHPDLPYVKEGERILEITPTYQRTYIESMLERIEPKKESSDNKKD